MMSSSKYPQVSSLLSLANIDVPGTRFRSRSCAKPLTIFEISLASVPGLFFVVDTLESNMVSPTRLGDNSEALGKRPVLGAFESFFAGLERLAADRYGKMS